MNRRKFIKLAAGTTFGLTATSGIAYPFLEARWCRVLRLTVGGPALPAPFVGTKVAFLADVHHGPFVPLSYVRHVVELTNSLAPDIVALGGDYVHRHHKYVAPAMGWR